MDCAVTENTNKMYVEYQRLEFPEVPEILLTYSEIQSPIL